MITAGRGPTICGSLDQPRVQRRPGPVRDRQPPSWEVLFTSRPAGVALVGELASPWGHSLGSVSGSCCLAFERSAVEEAMRKHSLLIFVNVAALVGSGCSFVEEQFDAATSLYGSTDKRVDAYITGCINGFSNSVFGFADTYFDWAPPESSLVTEDLSVQTIARREDCDDAILAGEDSSEQVDIAAVAYGLVVDDLYAVVSEVDSYYNRGTYKDDALARGITLHTEVVKQLEAFESVDGALRTAIDNTGAADRREVLEEASSSEVDFTTLVEASRIAAGGVIDALETPDGLVLAADHDLIDAAQFSAAVESFVELWDRVRAGESENGASDQYFAWSGFVSDGEDLIATANELSRRLQQPEPFTAEELENLDGPFRDVEGSPEHILDTFNDFVDAGNRL